MRHVYLPGHVIRVDDDPVNYDWLKEHRGVSKHLPGQHDQSSHGSWAHGTGGRATARSQLKQLLVEAVAAMPDNWKAIHTGMQMAERRKVFGPDNTGIRVQSSLDDDAGRLVDGLMSYLPLDDEVWQAMMVGTPEQVREKFANLLEFYGAPAELRRREDWRAMWAQRLERAEQYSPIDNPVLRPLVHDNERANRGAVELDRESFNELANDSWYIDENQRTDTEQLNADTLRPFFEYEAQNNVWFAERVRELEQQLGRPLTPAEIQPIRANAPGAYERVRQVAVENMATWTSTARQMIHISDAALDRVLVEGKFSVVNEDTEIVDPIGGETKTNQELRLEKEWRMFGMSPMARQQRVVYGYLTEADDLHGVVRLEAEVIEEGGYAMGAPGATLVANYGDISVRLKPVVRERSTYAIDDTFNPATAASKMGEADDYTVAGFGVWAATANGIGDLSGDWNTNSFATPRYIETQIHGGVRVSDIEAIVVPKGLFDPANELHRSIVARARDLKIPVEIVDRDGDGYVLDGTEQEQYVGQISKHLPNQHDQKSHGSWAKGRVATTFATTEEALAYLRQAHPHVQFSFPSTTKMIDGSPVTTSQLSVESANVLVSWADDMAKTYPDQWATMSLVSTGGLQIESSEGPIDIEVCPTNTGGQYYSGLGMIDNMGVITINSDYLSDPDAIRKRFLAKVEGSSPEEFAKQAESWDAWKFRFPEETDMVQTLVHEFGHHYDAMRIRGVMPVPKYITSATYTWDPDKFKTQRLASWTKFYRAVTIALMKKMPKMGSRYGGTKGLETNAELFLANHFGLSKIPRHASPTRWFEIMNESFALASNSDMDDVEWVSDWSARHAQWLKELRITPKQVDSIGFWE